MTEKQFHRELVAFLNAHISSVRQLEALLLFRSDPSKGWTPKNASKALCYNELSAEKWLKQFFDLGLLECRNELFYYKPSNESLDKLMDALANEYRVRPLKVIDIVVNRPTNRMMSFMDAFKIRKEEDDNDG